MGKLLCRILIAICLISVAAYAQDDGPPPEPLDIPPGAALSLPDAIELALQKNPGLDAFALDIRAADARMRQARLLPNPELSMELEDIRWTRGPSERSRTSSFSVTGTGWENEKAQGAHSGLSESEFTISIAQAIELGGKRSKRVAFAREEKQLVLWDYEAARADVAAQAGRAFVSLLAAQENLELRKELMDLAGKVTHVAQLRVEAGKASPLESTKAEVALASTKVAYGQALHGLHAARVRLSATWGEISPKFDKAEGTLKAAYALPEIEALTRSIEENPDMARWASEIAFRDAGIKLERSQRFPDLTLEFGFKTVGQGSRSTRRYGVDTGGAPGWSRTDSRPSNYHDNTFTAGLSIPLPIFNRNQGNIAVAKAMAARAGKMRRHTEVLIHAALVQAYEEAAAALAAVEILRGESLPKATDVYHKTQIGYREGKFDYLDVLDAQRTLFDARTSELDALAHFHLAAVDIERLTGQPLADTAEHTPLGDTENSHEK